MRLSTEMPYTARFRDTMGQSDNTQGCAPQRNTTGRYGEADRNPDVVGESSEHTTRTQHHEGLGLRSRRGSDYIAGSPIHEKPFYFVDIRIPINRLDLLAKQGLIRGKVERWIGVAVDER